MVAIKNEMNLGEDITDLGARKGKLNTKLGTETDAAKKQAMTDEITGIDAAIQAATTKKAGLAGIIAKLTTKVTETDADALTIEARIADEEAAIALAAAA